jgi:hypothetical protein
MSRVSKSLYGAAIADLTLTFTTDNPGLTADSTITIADGDSISSANTIAAIHELVSKINVMLAAMLAAGVIGTE